MIKILITGGAGFIGTHLSRRLLKEGCEITILDNFSPQIHGGSQQLSADLAPVVRLVRASVLDKDALADALEGQDAVVHLAAETGTGQSMYEITRYEEVNLKGTAVLLDLLVNQRARYESVRKLVVASSRAIYGEGRYRCETHGIVNPAERSVSAMSSGQFEPECPVCAAVCVSVPTDEDSPPRPTSFYGLTKRIQEDMVLMFARTLGISGMALRYQNVYGPGQSLKNPYTGILAVFSNLARAGARINVFEDGRESRDFVYIDDVVEATWRCIRPEASGVAAFNVGSGIATTVMEVAQAVVRHFGSSSPIEVSGAFRVGDIRHNVADLSRAFDVIGYQPSWRFADGLARFLDWAVEQEMSESGYARSIEELRARGLMHG